MCIWSFGNNQKGYLFGKHMELYKKAGHELVINKSSELILKLIPTIPQKYIDGILKQKDWHLRRIAYRQVMFTYNIFFKKIDRIKQRGLLETLSQLQQLQQLEQLEQLEQLQQLERLQQLEQLQRLQQLEEATFQSGDYQDVIIPDGAVIYCDPPYKGTAEYKEGGFNHEEFWDWCRNKSKTHKVYVSEYTAPDDFESILEFEQKSTLQGGNQTHNNQPKECLFRLIKKLDKN
jgi:hypothetical protein